MLVVVEVVTIGILTAILLLLVAQVGVERVDYEEALLVLQELQI